MPGNGDPESGERLQVGGGHSWLGLVEAEHGSLVLICQLLTQAVAVEEGNIWCLELSKSCIVKEDS